MGGVRGALPTLFSPLCPSSAVQMSYTDPWASWPSPRTKTGGSRMTLLTLAMLMLVLLGMFVSGAAAGDCNCSPNHEDTEESTSGLWVCTTTRLVAFFFFFFFTILHYCL